MSMLQAPLHPGKVLKELYLMPLKLSAIGLAKWLDVPRTRIERLVKGQTAMTTDTALRLAKFFKTTPQYWLNMQINFDMVEAKKSTDLSAITPLQSEHAA